MKVAALFLIATSGLAMGDSYTRTINLEPLALNRAKLTRVTERWRNFISAANRDAKCTDTPKTEVSDDTTKLTFDAVRIAEFLSRAPNPIKGFEFAYLCVDKASPIATVHLTFADYQRTISIDGNKPDQVDALASLVEADFKDSHFHGGSAFRANVNFVLWLLLLAASLLDFVLPRIGIQIPNSWWLTIGIVIFGSFLFILGSNLERLFPGFAVYEGDVAFHRRNETEINLVLAVVPLAIGVVGWMRKTALRRNATLI